MARYNSRSGSRWSRDAMQRPARPVPRLGGLKCVGRDDPGDCYYCGETVAAGAGLLERSTGGQWLVKHRPAEWAGSPVSGRYVGGCPDDTARLNERLTEART